MRARLRPPDREAGAARARAGREAARYRIAGTALIGLAVLAWWAGRSAGAW